MISCLIFMVSLFLVQHWWILSIYLLLILFFYSLAKLQLKLAFRNIRGFWGLFLITFLIHGFFTHGRILFEIPSLSARMTFEGLVLGLYYTLRLGILIILANLLTLTTSPMSLTDGIERFMKPLKRFGVPAHEIAMMLSISIRFIPLLIDESDRIRKAQLSRGSRFEGNIVDRIRSIIPLVIPLFVSAFRRAHELALAMEARCYRGGEGRTSYDVLVFQQRDFGVLLSVIFLTIPVTLLDRMVSI